MSKFSQISCLLAFTFIIGCGQTATKASAFDTLLEEGYEVLFNDTLSTGQKEFVIAGLRSIREDSLMQEVDTMLIRPLLILEKQASGEFDITLRNDHVILCPDCGGVMGDPLEGMDITEYHFTIYHHGGSRYRWTRNISFEYQPERDVWLLLIDQGVTFDSLDPEGDMEVMMYTPLEEAQEMLFEDYKTN